MQKPKPGISKWPRDLEKVINQLVDAVNALTPTPLTVEQAAEAEAAAGAQPEDLEKTVKALFEEVAALKAQLAQLADAGAKTEGDGLCTTVQDIAALAKELTAEAVSGAGKQTTPVLDEKPEPASPITETVAEKVDQPDLVDRQPAQSEVDCDPA